MMPSSSRRHFVYKCKRHDKDRFASVSTRKFKKYVPPYQKATSRIMYVARSMTPSGYVFSPSRITAQTTVLNDGHQSPDRLHLLEVEWQVGQFHIRSARGSEVLGYQVVIPVNTGNTGVYCNRSQGKQNSQNFPWRDSFCTVRHGLILSQESVTRRKQRLGFRNVSGLGLGLNISLSGLGMDF
jgi:hypothetical protein